MSAEAVEFIAPSRPVGQPAQAAQSSPLFATDEVAGAAAPEKTGGTFASWFTQQMQAVESKLGAADQHLQSLAMGETQNLHQVMISLEEARLSFQLLMQVRNRALESYQEVLRMQI